MEAQHQTLKALHDAVSARFAAQADLRVQMFMPARVSISGARVSGSKAEGLYHLEDGEVGRNTADIKPIAALLTKAVKALGFDSKRTNAALLAQRNQTGVDLYIIAVAPGDSEQGEAVMVDARNLDKVLKGDPKEEYLFPLPVGYIFDIASDGSSKSEKEVGAELWGAPIPWGNREIDKAIQKQIWDALWFNPPVNATISKIGI